MDLHILERGLLQTMPTKVRVEASSRCQLRCPSCPTASGATRSAIDSGFLAFENFKRFVDDSPWIAEIELSNYGEMFLNPELLEIIKYAHLRGVRLTARNGVNFNSVSEKILVGLCKYKFHSLSCSIDGASQETYGLYRINGDFHRVIDNVSRLNALKRLYGTEFPHLYWQYIIFGYNESEITLARELARRLGMKFSAKLAWDATFSPVRDADLVRREVGIGAASRDEYESKYGIDYMQGICNHLWDGPQINWDGKVLGCCRNFWGDFGANVFTEGLSRSVNNEKMRYARELLQGHQETRIDIPCATCSIYNGMKASGRWLGRETGNWINQPWVGT